MTQRGTTGAKTPRASRVVMTESVLPGDGNPLGTAFGGRIAQWIDVAAAIDDLHFLKPIRVGMTVELRAQVNATFRTSMESGVRIESENPLTGERAHVCTAYLTFVAQDEKGRPVPVPRWSWRPTRTAAASTTRSAGARCGSSARG